MTNKDPAKRLLGFDIGGTKCTVVLAGADGSPAASRLVPTACERGPRALVERLLEEARAMLGERGLGTGDIARLGIACGGPLDTARGLVLSPPNLPGWDDFPIVRLVSEKFPGAEVFLENDANASALAEWKFGAGLGTRNMVFLTFGTGLGAGIILDGKLYSGSNGMAGEIGHWRMADDGPEAYGKRGSFEGFCSGAGLAKPAELRLRKGLSAKDVVAAALGGDSFARQIIAESARTLGRGLALLIDLLNPEAVVIGGIYARAEALFRDIAAEEIKKEALERAAAVCRIVPAALGESLPLYAPIAVILDSGKRVEGGVCP